MPYKQLSNGRIHYDDNGEGAQTLFFSHGLLFNSHMFDKQVEYFSSKYRCISYDHRGQGKSEKGSAGLDMDSLADDAVELIETLGIAPCHFVGLSMGGFVGMRLAARNSALLHSLTLLNTDAGTEPNKFKYRLLVKAVELFGVRPVVGRIMPILFGSKFLNDPERAAELQQWTNFMGDHEKSITAAVKGVIDRKAIAPELGNIKIPTLIGFGELDMATVPSKSKKLHGKIEGSRMQCIEGAGHTSTIEEGDAVNQIIDAFLNSLKE